MKSILFRELTLYLKLFFLLTPFFVLSIFISLTAGINHEMKAKLAWRITLGCIGVTLAIFLCGTYIMKVFDITVDAFRMGSGVLLLLTAINQVMGKQDVTGPVRADLLLDMAVVPLAVPITAGPATLGTLMVMGTMAVDAIEKLLTALAIVLSCGSVGLMLYLSNKLMDFLGRSNISILSKLSGLILCAIAMQMIVVGAKNLWMVP